MQRSLRAFVEHHQTLAFRLAHFGGTKFRHHPLFQHRSSWRLDGMERRRYFYFSWLAPSHASLDCLAIALFILLMIREPKAMAAGIPTRKRRVLAFVIDFCFSLFTISSVDALIPLWLEAVRTGHFIWHFQRNYSVNTDSLSLLSSLLFLALMVLYFVFPLTRGRQTVGYFIMRLKVTPPFGDEGRFTLKAALLRTFWAFMGVARNWDQDSQGRTWYDRKTGCEVVLVSD